MISPAQAKKLIAANLIKIKNQKINTNTSIGYTLNETIYAERDQPPFDRVTMDGIAVNSRTFKNNNYQQALLIKMVLFDFLNLNLLL